MSKAPTAMIEDEIDRIVATLRNPGHKVRKFSAFFNETADLIERLASVGTKQADLERNVRITGDLLEQARINHHVALQVLRRYRLPKGQRAKEKRDTT